MTSTAVSAQGSVLAISSGIGGARTITGVVLGSPTIIQATAHGFGNGDYVAIAGVVGSTQVIGSWTVRSKTANTFAIDLNSTGGAAYTSGGTATPVTWTDINNMRTFTGFDGAANVIDVTNLKSLAEEIRLGLPRFGQIAFEIDWDNTDPGHLALLAKQLSGALSNFRLTLPDASVASFSAYVSKVPRQGGIDAVVRGTIDLRITGTVVWS